MPAPLRDVPQEGIELIKRFEGIPDGDPSTVRLDPYLDPAGIWTIGWGHAITHQGTMLSGPQNKGIARALYPGGITLEQAEMLLRGELVNFARDVLRLAKGTLDDGQFAALVSFAFNCGSGNLGTSTLLHKLNSGDQAGAADQFLVWNKVRKNGALVEVPRLTWRRRAERALFLGQDWRAVSDTRTGGAPAASRTMAPERPEPPPNQQVEAPPAAAKAKKVRAAAKAPAPPAAPPAPAAAAPSAAVKTPAATSAAVMKPVAAPTAGKKPVATPAAGKKPVAATAAVEKPAATPVAVKKPVAATADVKKSPATKPAKTPARTTTPKAPPKAPRAAPPAPRTKR